MKTAELERLVEEMKNPRPFIRGKAVDSFMLVRDEAVIPVLYKMVQREMDFIKVQYCRLMGKLHSPQAVAPLAALLLGPSEKVAEEAAEALGLIDDDTTVEALMSLISHENRFARTFAIKTLGTQKRIKAVPLLINALSVPDAELRQLVIDALREIGDPAAIFPLTRLLSDPNEETIYDAIYALGEIGDKLTGTRLAAFLDHKNDDIRRAAVWGLGKLEYTPAISKFIQMLKSDPNDEVREEICRRLAKFDGKRVLEALAATRSSDKAHNVRVYADWSLKEIQKEAKDESISKEVDEILKGHIKRK